ncbi:MAG TPA: glycosyltransferase, partial [Acidimicrobiales bacterium]
GFWGWEHDAIAVGGRFRWTSGDARLLVPATGGGGGTRVELDLACGLGARDVEVRCGDERVHASVAERPSTVGVVASGVFDVVNNAGTEWREDGSSVDRGFLDADTGQFDEQAEVFGWSGAAVLLRAAYVSELGGFDEALFLYYEDNDMSWRGRRRGWRYACVPASVVRHEHSATAGSAAALVHHLMRRNRLLVLTKHAPGEVVVRAVGELVRDLGAAAWRDVVRAAAAGRRPRIGDVKSLARVTAGYARHAPGALRYRVREGGRAS